MPILSLSSTLLISQRYHTSTYLTIHISFLSSIDSCPFFIGHVSLAYVISARFVSSHIDFTFQFERRSFKSQAHKKRCSKLFFFVFSKHISGLHTAFWPRDALLSEIVWHYCSHRVTTSPLASWYQFTLLGEQGRQSIKSLSRAISQKVGELNNRTKRILLKSNNIKSNQIVDWLV